MNHAEIPMIALAMIRSYGDDAFLKASHRAIKSRRAGDFETARAWQRIAEIAHYEQLMATEEGAGFENGTKALPSWRQWLINTSRDLRLNHLLTHRAPPAVRAFGVELDLTKAIDWILGHAHAHTHHMHM
jgi:hypothetical protein